MTGRVTHLGVVIPARNEERLLPRCLDAVVAAERLAARGGLTVRVLVVLDRCVDGSARVARLAGADTLHTTYGVVGAARAAGAAEVLGDWVTAGVDPGSAWLACTDADSIVPERWLVRQAELAGRGIDCVAGTVEPLGLPEALHAAWHRRHRLADGHGYVHGANLGVRARAYLAAGGFEPVRAHEDVALVERLRRAGYRCLATDSIRVGSSGRLRSRVEDGFAAYLARLPGAPSLPTIASSAPLTAPLVSPFGTHGAVAAP